MVVDEVGVALLDAYTAEELAAVEDAGASGVLYAVGGFDGRGALSSVEAYDPATKTWSAVASMMTARYGLAVGVLGGSLYAVGGWSGRYGPSLLLAPASLAPSLSAD